MASSSKQSLSENPLAFRKLYESSLVTVLEYACSACRSGPAAEEHSEVNSIVLVRHGAFSRHFDRRIVTANVNEAAFFSKGSSYRVSHPGECGDRGTVFSPSQKVLSDIIREFDPSIDDHPDSPFPLAAAPCEAHIFHQYRELTQRLEAESGFANAVQADEMIVGLAAATIETAFRRMRLPLISRKDGSRADHADRAEAVKSHLASHLGERVTLEGLSRAVHASPFHLARLFQRHTGVPIHRYLTRLRLRTSLELLADGEKDITSLALELGFSSHSHLSDAFRREFGFTPSEARRKTTGRALREMSKNLEA